MSNNIREITIEIGGDTGPLKGEGLNAYQVADTLKKQGMYRAEIIDE